MALPIAKVDSMPRFEKGPDMAVEGYLQLKKALSKPNSRMVLVVREGRVRIYCVG